MTSCDRRRRAAAEHVRVRVCLLLDQSGQSRILAGTVRPLPLMTQSGHRTTGVAAVPPPMCAGLFSYHFVHIYVVRGRYGAAFLRP